jgi:hypothetical protein
MLSRFDVVLHATGPGDFCDPAVVEEHAEAGHGDGV